MFKTITTLGAAALIAVGLTTAQAQTYTNNTSFGAEGAGSSQFQYPTGVAFAADGKILISDLMNKRMSVWTQSGNTFGNHSLYDIFGTGLNEFKDVRSIAVGTDGKIFIADYFNRRISVWTQSGNNFGALTNFVNPNSDYPNGVSISPIDGLIFAPEAVYHTIGVWKQTGNTFNKITSFGSSGSALNQFNNPKDVEVAPDGKIYVSDAGNHRISVWTQSGTTFGVVTTFGGSGQNPENTSGPSGVKISPDGKIFVSNTNNNCISIWTNSGNNFGYVSFFGGSLFNKVPMQYPNKVNFDANGNVYVPEGGNHRISIWSLPPPIAVPASTKNTQEGNITLNGTVDKACDASTKTFTVSVSGSFLVRGVGSGCAAGTNTYSWYYDNNTANNTNDDILLSQFNNNTNISLSGANLSVGGYYVTVGTCRTVRIPTMGGAFLETSVQKTETSDSYNFNPSVSIATQPTSQTACSGSNASLNIGVTGTYPQYIWSTGATTAGINVPEGAYMITVNGLCNSVVSNEATVSNSASTQITSHPVSVSTCLGTFATFEVSATGTGALSYAWSNAASTTNTMMTSTAGTNYNVTVSGDCGNAVSNTFNYESRELTKIITQPVGATLCGQALIAVTAVGVGITYNWNHAAGNFASFYTSTPGDYTVTISGSCGVVVSNTINYAKYEPFNMVTNANDKSILPGETTSLSVSATGSNIAYLWSNGATTNSISGLNAGTYSVSITGACGSNSFSPTVREVPNPTITGIFTEGNPATATTATITGLGFIHGGKGGMKLMINNVNAGIKLGTGSTYVIVSLVGESLTPPNNLEKILLSSTTGAIMYAINRSQDIPSATVTLTAINVLQPIATVNGVSLSGTPANSITISGSGFVNGATVTVNGVVLTNITVVNGTTIVATLPSGFNASSVSVVVQNANQVASTPVVVNTLPPVSTATVSGVTLSGTPANSITISGAGFANGATVTVNGVVLTNTVVNGNTIVATLPSGFNANSVSVAVQNFGQSASSPTVIVNPINNSVVSATVTGVVTNGNITTITSSTFITISGVGFTPGTNVTINGVSVPVVAGIGTNTLLVNLPVGVITSTGAINVQVANPNQAPSVGVSIVPIDKTATSTNLPAYQSTSFSIFPNPTSNGDFKIESPLTPEGGILAVYNAQGSVVYSQKIVSESTLVNANLTSGIYLVKVGNATKKLVVE